MKRRLPRGFPPGVGPTGLNADGVRGVVARFSRTDACRVCGNSAAWIHVLPDERVDPRAVTLCDDCARGVVAAAYLD